MLDIPIKLDDGDIDSTGYFKRGCMKLPLLLPRDVLHCVHTEIGLTVEIESVRSYWQRASENGAGWALLQDDHDAIPVGIYADETKYGLHESQEKILAIFLNLVLFRPKNIRLSRFLLCSIRSKLLLPGTATLYPIFNRILWSMGWASRGLFPTTGMFGAPLTPKQGKWAGQSLGAKFFVTELRGDLAWHKQLWGISDGWQSTKVCFFCNAVGTGRRHNLYYTNTGEDADWRGTIYRDTLKWAHDKLDLNKLCFLFK